MSSSRSSVSKTNTNRFKNDSWWMHYVKMADRNDMMRWIGDKIRSYAQNSVQNRLDSSETCPMFDDPIIGFASGADPLFSELKEIIGSFHMAPCEWLEEEARLSNSPLPMAKETGVITYVLPITAKTRRNNSSMISAPSNNWAYTRLYGEKFNKDLESYIVALLRQQGYLAVAPDLSPSFRIVMDERVGSASNWSHRHTAYAAGLGSFGISDGFITKRGIAHRLGSVVVNIPFPSPKRRTLHPDCLHFQTGMCMACAKRCPAGAITKEGHDKKKCREFVYSQIPYIREHYNINIYACGLCQTGVPCENKSPVRPSE